MVELIDLPEKTPSKLRLLLDDVISGMAEQEELIKIRAKMKRVEYDAYVEEGFTPEQALTLCKESSA